MTVATVCVLLVEDDLDVRESLVDALESEGYRVLAARDGVEALEHLRTNPAPALILLDMMMPRMNGYEFREVQRATPGWSAIPVIIFSADADLERKAAELGVADFVKKPMKLKPFMAAVHRLSGRHP